MIIECLHILIIKFNKDEEGEEMEIGKKLKKYRVLNGLTQEELANRCEVSKGFLSQIENDLTSPSISTLEDIVEALGIDLATFFKDDKQEQFVFSQEDYFIDEQTGFLRTFIVPNAQKNEMEPIMLELEAGSKSPHVVPFEGECFGYILEGSLVLKYGVQEKVVNKGETFYIDGSTEHYLNNKSQSIARLIWVSTPPIF